MSLMEPLFWGVFMGVFALCIDLELNWKLLLFMFVGYVVSRCTEESRESYGKKNSTGNSER